jgi:hypothetical protein
MPLVQRQRPQVNLLWARTDHYLIGEKKMSDGKRTCLGFGFLIAALVFAGAAVYVGGMNALVGGLVSWMQGGSFTLDVGTAWIIGIGIFVAFSAIAIIIFLSLKNWSWLPAILGGVYTVMPDLIFGQADDALAIVLGVLASGLLAWRRERRKELPAEVE